MENNEQARLVGKPSRWPWILLVLLLALVAIAALAYMNRDNVNVSDETKQQMREPAENSVNNVTNSVQQTTQNAITDVKSIISSTDVTSLRDRTVNFDNLTVKSVGTNDMVFWINDSGATDPSQMQGRDILVHMNEQLQSQVRMMNSNSALKDGARLSVSGMVKLLPTVEELQSKWMLNPDDANYAKNKTIYIEASNVMLK